MKITRLLPVLVGLLLVVACTSGGSPPATEETSGFRPAAPTLTLPGQTLNQTQPQPLRETQSEGQRATGPSNGAAGQNGPSVTPTPVSDLLRTDAYAVEELLINVYQRVSPAVVHIQIGTGGSGPFGSRTGSGSGFVLDQAGHIVTNNHVVEDAETIDVIFADGTVADAEVLGADPAVDLAVLQVDAPADVLVPVELGNSDALKIGQRAIAIGNPFGEFDQSMTAGIVSGLGRVIDPTDEGEFIPELIQTDAAINPGNSGGPLLDSRGRVIGINTLIFSVTGTSAGVGFAVPVNTLRRTLPALLEGREVGRPWLGIAGPPALDASLVEELGLPSEAGAYVSYVFADGPADEAGLIGGSESSDGPIQSGGDLIVAVNGVSVVSFNDLLGYLGRETRVGQTVKLTVLRDGTTMTIPLTLGERPDS